jgi:hypothetical protein
MSRKLFDDEDTPATALTLPDLHRVELKLSRVAADLEAWHRSRTIAWFALGFGAAGLFVAALALVMVIVMRP